jgi:hypothetical protein
MNDLELMTNEEGIPLPDVLGTTKMTGNLLYYGNNYRVEVTEEVDSGGASGGSSSDDVVTGYKYYLSWAMGFCLGPIDNLYTVWADDKIVWAGDIPFSEAINGEVTIALATGDRGEHEELGDALGEIVIEGLIDKGAEIEDGFMGLMTLYFGTDDQVKNSLLGELMLEEGAIESLDYHIPYRRQVYAYLHNNYIGDYNRCPTIKLVVRKAPECSFDT